MNQGKVDVPLHSDGIKQFPANSERFLVVSDNQIKTSRINLSLLS